MYYLKNLTSVTVHKALTNTSKIEKSRKKEGMKGKKWRKSSLKGTLFTLSKKKKLKKKICINIQNNLVNLSAKGRRRGKRLEFVFFF